MGFTSSVRGLQYLNGPITLKFQGQGMNGESINEQWLIDEEVAEYYLDNLDSEEMPLEIAEKEKLNSSYEKLKSIVQTNIDDTDKYNIRINMGMISINVDDMKIRKLLMI